MDEELLFRSILGRTDPEEETGLERSGAGATSEHRRELAALLSLARAAEPAVRFGRPPTGDELLRHARARRGRPRAGVWPLALVAASIAAIAFLPTLWRGDPAPAIDQPVSLFGADAFTTGAEAATVGLRDGTLVRLAPASRLRLLERRDAREVTLAGRGFFAVASDPGLPFIIHGEAGTVTVVGTRFDLTVDGDDLRLVVLEGRVRLSVPGSEVDVEQGQMAQVLDGNLAPPIDVPDPQSLIEWVGDFIAFQDTPLRTVAREIEKRHGVRIEFSEPSLGDRTVTAFFAGRSFEEIAEVVCVIARLRCTREGPAVLRVEPE